MQMYPPSKRVIVPVSGIAVLNVQIAHLPLAKIPQVSYFLHEKTHITFIGYEHIVSIHRKES